MTGISAALVKELRDQTGAPMMDCKRALVDTTATSKLPSACFASAAWQAPRSARDVPRPKARSATASAMTPSSGRWSPSAAKPSRCRTTTSSWPSRRRCSRQSRPTGRTGRSTRRGAEGVPGKLGENLVVAGATRFEAVNGGLIEGYAHPPANKLGVLVQVRGGSGDIARKIAMHIAASSPQWVGKEDVPEEVVSSEREIFANSDEVLSKPDQAREKIVEGMLNKRFFADRVLTEQPWIHDTGKTVGQALSEEAPRCWSSSGSPSRDDRSARGSDRRHRRRQPSLSPHPAQALR